jgi:hypothetical protein
MYCTQAHIACSWVLPDGLIYLSGGNQPNQQVLGSSPDALTKFPVIHAEDGRRGGFGQRLRPALYQFRRSEFNRMLVHRSSALQRRGSLDFKCDLAE